METLKQELSPETRLWLRRELLKVTCSVTSPEFQGWPTVSDYRVGLYGN